VRTFLITLLVSIVASIVLWNLGLAHLIWPGHPYAATVLFATLLAWGVQSYLTKRPSKDPKQE